MDMDELLERGAPSVSVPHGAKDAAARFVNDPTLLRLPRRRRRVLLAGGIIGALAFGGTTAFAVSGVPTHLGWFATVGTSQKTSLGAICDNAIGALPERNAEVAEYASEEEKQRATDRANELLAAMNLDALDISGEIDRLTAEVDGAITAESDAPPGAMNANGIETWALFSVAVDQVTAQLVADGIDPNIVTFQSAAECDSPMWDQQ